MSFCGIAGAFSLSITLPERLKDALPDDTSLSLLRLASLAPGPTVGGRRAAVTGTTLAWLASVDTGCGPSQVLEACALLFGFWL